MHGEGPEIALGWRSPDFHLPAARLVPAGAAIIDDLSRGVPLTPATRDRNPVPVLTLLLHDRLFWEAPSRCSACPLPA